MNPEELRRIIASGESFTVEFKAESRSAPSDSDLVETVVCLANGEGGTLLVGVEDDGRMTGARPRHEAGRTDPARLAALVSNRTRPSLSVRVDLLTLDRRPVLAISVPKADRPVGTSDGRYVRRALGGTGKPECVPYHFHEMQSRLATQGALDPSMLEVTGSSWSDLDSLEIERFRRLVRENPARGDSALLGLSDLDLAKALGGVTADGEVRTVRLLGLLLFGREEALRRFVPTHEVAFQALRGSKVEVNDFFRRPLLRVVEDFEERFRARHREEEIFLGATRIGLPEFAPQALREALANALTHRDYSRLGAVHVQWRDDRVDVLSPGGFPEGVRLDNLLVVAPRPRNPALADAFKRAGLVERTARGVDLIFEAQVRAGRPLPDYGRSDEVGVAVSLLRGPARKGFVLRLIEEERRGEPFSFQELLAFDGIDRSGAATASDVASRLQTTEREAEGVLESLLRRHCIVASGAAGSRTFRPVGPRAPIPPGSRGSKDLPLAETERRVLEAARAGAGLTRRSIAADLGVSSDQAKRLLERLVGLGALVRVGHGRGVSYRARPIKSGAPNSESGAPEKKGRARKRPGRKVAR